MHARSQKRLIAIAVAVFLCARFARFLRSRYARHIGVRSARTLAQLPQYSICSRMTNTQQGSRLYPSLSLALSHARPVWHAAGITLRSLLATLRFCENCAWQIPRKLGSCHTQPFRCAQWLSDALSRKNLCLLAASLSFMPSALATLGTEVSAQLASSLGSLSILFAHARQTTAAACAPYRKPKKASPHCASYASANAPNGTAVCVVAICVVAVCLGVLPPKPLHAAPSAAAPIRALASLFVSFAVCGSWRFPCAYAQAPSTDFAVSCGRGVGEPPCLVSRGGSRFARPHSRRAQPPAPPRYARWGLSEVGCVRYRARGRCRALMPPSARFARGQR